MRKSIFIITPAILIASTAIAYAQASGGGAGVGAAGAGGHAGGASGAHPAGVTGSAAPSGKSGTGTMPQSGQQPGCAGTATPSTSTTGIKPPC